MYLSKYYQNSKSILELDEKDYVTNIYEKNGYWYAMHDMSYTIFEHVSEYARLKYEVTNAGMGYYKWEIKGFETGLKTTSNSKRGAKDIIHADAKKFLEKIMELSL
jgi:hypothetical protein